MNRSGAHLAEKRLLVAGGRNGVGGAPKQQALLTECASSLKFVEIKTVDVPEWPRLPVLVRIVARMWWVRKQATAFRADVVLLWQTHAILTSPGLILSGIRVVGSERSNAGAFKGRLYQLMYGFSIRRLDCFVVQTYEAAVFAKQKYGAQAEVAGNIANLRLFPTDQTRANKDSFPRCIHFLSVGRLVKSKRFDLVMEAMSKLKAGSEWRWTIVGNGPEYQSLVKMRASLNLVERVFFKGELTAVELARVYASSSVLVSASEREGYPNVLMEGSLYGLRILSSDCQFGPREILEGYQPAEFFETGDLESLLLKLQDEVQKPRNGLRGDELWNWHEVIRKRSRDAVDNWFEILELGGRL